MRNYLATQLTQAFQAFVQAEHPDLSAELMPSVAEVAATFERPQDASHGDWSSTFALKNAKTLKMAPRAIAEGLLAHLTCDDELVAQVDLAGAGFINFTLTPLALAQVVERIREQGEAFGASDLGQGRSIQVEFVSANPVGPMHIGHGRWAALGDSLCRVLAHAGWKVQREFYINDAGSQMDVFGRSISMRYEQIANLITQGKTLAEAHVLLIDDREESGPYHEEFGEALGEDSYGGSYIIDIASDFYEREGDALLKLSQEERIGHFREVGYQDMMTHIKAVLADCRVVFDEYFSERSVHEVQPGKEKNEVDLVIDRLRDRGYIYDKDGAVWFRSTDFGDDKDRVLVKADGSYTYFAPDIAYHANKFDRGFDRVIDLWGADHHGYVKRMKSAMDALGNEGKLDVLLGQMVKLLRNQVPVKMSKRKGTMVTFEELLQEVGVDATRYTLLSRSSDQEIDFDIELAKSQSADNPVYYVQYAHARICSILRRAEEERGVVLDESAGFDTAVLARLSSQEERALLLTLERFENVCMSAARDLAPFRLTHYAQDLAASFHGFYAHHHVLEDDESLMIARLALCDATRRVLSLTLGLLGVSAPERM